MSKSKGNVIDPLDVINSGYGADTLRTYELFIGPYDQDAAWSTEAIGGVFRFMNRCYTLTFDKECIKEDTNLVIRNKTIKKVTEDMHRNYFNTAVAAMMEFVNELYKNGASEEDLKTLARLLKPFAPHLACEMLEKLDADDEWPKWDEAALVADKVEMVVQVNGKLRARIMVAAEDATDQAKMEELALADARVKTYTDGKTIIKKIVIPKNRLVNIVVK
jgi:leucyl-tRNA synthetase